MALRVGCLRLSMELVVDTEQSGFLYFSRMRLLGLDLGTKNIGVAVSDALGISVRAVETVRRTKLADDFARLAALAAELEVEGVVIGLPVRLDGSLGDAAQRTLQFIEQFKATIAVPVFMQDERLTSYEAEQMMIERGLNREQRRAQSDEFAAILILQDYLATRRTER